MYQVRNIEHNELEKLLYLYTLLHPEDPVVEKGETLKKLWDEIYNDPSLYYFVVEENEQIISSCTISIIKNLTRNLRPYGLIENVVTHPDYRNRGLGTMVLKKAIDVAMDNNCYKVMLLTGSKKEETLRFYVKAGFSMGIKTGFIMML